MNKENTAKLESLKATGRSVKKELKLFFENFVYLAICLSVLETYRSLVLIQFGINQFVHGYTIAISAALVMGKLVTIVSHRAKVLESFDHKPLIWSVLFRSFVMTILVLVFKAVEELIFHSAHTIAGPHGILLTLCHSMGVMFVFSVLFTTRGLDRRLGQGALNEIFFGIKKPKSIDPAQEKEEKTGQLK